jgi:peptidoglycan/LPS O-acetylase OafA/YrhL
MQHAMHEAGQSSHQGHYGRLVAMVALSFVAMYILMYAMVDAFGNVYNSVNQAYMAGLMAAPMLLIELALMRFMYPSKRWNAGLAAAAVAIAVLCWIGIRQQAGVTDQQFLRSMIPHHAGAVLMCTRNRLQDPELQQLCREIVSSQVSEIAQMKAKLR